MTGLLLERLTVRAGGHDVLTAVDLLVPAGTSLGVLGAAQAGKTTVLRTIAGDLEPVSGRVLLGGRAIDGAAVGVVSQRYDLLGGLTAVENLAARGFARGGLTDDDWVSAERLLAELAMPESARHNLVEQLSGGQQQRVAVARALVGEPDLLCLDAPTSELDSASGDLVWRMLHAACARGAVVVVTVPDEAEAERCDAVLRLPTP